MAPAPPRRQATGHVDWTLSLDLTRLTGSDVFDELDALLHPSIAGQRVTVRVGTSTPTQADARVVELLVGALRNGVCLVLDGSPRAVARWWRALLPRTPDVWDQCGRRHLRVVQ